MDLNYQNLNKKHINLTFKWSNLKSVVSNSIRKKRLKYYEHEKWFNKNLKSKKNIVKIIYKNKTPIGIIRFEKKYLNFVISYMIVPNFRKKGNAFNALNFQIQKIKKKDTKIKFITNVKKHNKASIKIFEKLGFSLIKKKGIILTYRSS